MSPTLMQAYLTAAAEISRLAVGDPAATAREATYPVSRWTSQREQVEGAPHGTRGGVSVVHTFPADGDYRFRVSFYHETTGRCTATAAPPCTRPKRPSRSRSPSMASASRCSTSTAG
jgi:hypothetical protein